MSIGTGTVGAYIGTWVMITGPSAVEKIIHAAASGLDGKGLLEICREIGKGGKAF